MSLEIKIGGFEPLTTIDYPDNLSCVIFTQGCPWDCVYCHNQDLIPVGVKTKFSWSKILEFITSRIGLLDAVVFSGGEPLLQTELIDAMKKVKKLGFKVGLHTAGVYPRRLKQCLKYVDWVGFDIKHLPLEYEKITQTPKSANKAFLSLDILQKSGVNYQLRTTKSPDLISANQILQLKKLIKTQYSSNLVMQNLN